MELTLLGDLPHSPRGKVSFPGKVRHETEVLITSAGQMNSGS